MIEMVPFRPVPTTPAGALGATAWGTTVVAVVALDFPAALMATMVRA